MGEQLPVPLPAGVLAALADAARARELGEEWAGAAVAALDWGRRAGDLDGVVDAARVVDAALLGVLSTGAWGLALAAGADAAHERGREHDEAYFLHQQGTRSLCLGERELAEDRLRQALALRRRLGDEAGTAATLHNLDVLHGQDGSSVPVVEASAVGVGAQRAAIWAPGSLGRWAAGAIGLALGVILGILIGQGTSATPAAVTTVVKATTYKPFYIRLPGRTRTIVVDHSTAHNTTTNIPAAPSVTTTDTTTTLTTTTLTTTTVTTTIDRHNQVCIDC
ncbi:MAG: hypothetical protein ACLP50_12765 [Solirubrobacteraceae bacterium]